MKGDAYFYEQMREVAKDAIADHARAVRMLPLFFAAGFLAGVAITYAVVRAV